MYKRQDLRIQSSVRRQRNAHYDINIDDPFEPARSARDRITRHRTQQYDKKQRNAFENQIIEQQTKIIETLDRIFIIFQRPRFWKRQRIRCV